MHLLIVLVGLLGCVKNPALGRLQLGLVGEGNEILLGELLAGEVEEGVGLLAHPGAAGLVQEAGLALVAVCERPSLPWRFAVLDDPAVNAFALPGGRVYVTRGLLAQLSSREQLTAVLAHEMAHITARHAVTQMNRGVVAQAGVDLADSLDRSGTGLSTFTRRNLGVLFLRYRRSQERQADDLAVGYLRALDIDPHVLVDVLALVQRIEASAEGQLPQRRSTHPDTADRQARIARGLVDRGGGEPTADAGFVQALDGMLYGDNAREGFFVGSTFHHPDLALSFEIPPGFVGLNLRDAVVAFDHETATLLQLSGTGLDGLASAPAWFESQVGRPLDVVEERAINGIPAMVGEISVVSDAGITQAWVAWLDHRGAIFQVMGLCGEGQAVCGGLVASIESFRPLHDRSILMAVPMHLEVFELRYPASMVDFVAVHGSPLDVQALADLNQVGLDDVMPAGTLVKRVLGYNPAAPQR